MSEREVVSVNRKPHPTPIIIYKDEMVKGDVLVSEKTEKSAKKKDK